MTKLTLKTAQTELRPLNVILRKVEGEYQVKRREWTWEHPGVFFTSDLYDAVTTGKTIAAQPVDENADKVKVIEPWWDNISKNWIIQLKDAEGNQIGAADIVGNKGDARTCVRWAKEKYPKATIVSTRKDMQNP